MPYKDYYPDCNFTRDKEDQLEKLYTDTYLGDGKDNPSMATRMYSMEKAVEDTNRLTQWAIKIAVTTLIAIVGFLIKQTFFK